METIENEKAVIAPNANDFLGGNYLRKEDISAPITATLTNVWTEAVLNGGRKKLIVSFKEVEKPLILNKTNIKRFARIFSTGDTTAWRGPVVVYVEPGVEYAGRVVGGIRVRPAESLNASDDSSGQASSAATNGHASFEDSESSYF